MRYLPQGLIIALTLNLAPSTLGIARLAARGESAPSSRASHFASGQGDRLEE